MTSGVTARVTRATAGFEFDAVALALRAAVDRGRAEAPSDAEALGIPVAIDGDVPAAIGVDRDLLLESGFSGALGQTLVLPRGERPGRRRGRSRRAAVRSTPPACATPRRRSPGPRPVMAGWRPRSPTSRTSTPRRPDRPSSRASSGPLSLSRLRRPAERGAADRADAGGRDRPGGWRGGRRRAWRVTTAEAVQVARDLCNTPATHLTATRMAEVADRPRGRDRPGRRGLRQGRAGRARAAAGCSA